MRPGSLSTASLLAQWATLDLLTFSIMLVKRKGSSLEWKTVEAATGLMKLSPRLLEAVAWYEARSPLV